MPTSVVACCTSIDWKEVACNRAQHCCAATGVSIIKSMRQICVRRFQRHCGPGASAATYFGRPWGENVDRIAFSFLYVPLMHLKEESPSLSHADAEEFGVKGEGQVAHPTAVKEDHRLPVSISGGEEGRSRPYALSDNHRSPSSPRERRWRSPRSASSERSHSPNQSNSSHGTHGPPFRNSARESSQCRPRVDYNRKDNIQYRESFPHDARNSRRKHASENNFPRSNHTREYFSQPRGKHISGNSHHRQNRKNPYRGTHEKLTRNDSAASHNGNNCFERASSSGVRPRVDVKSDDIQEPPQHPPKRARCPTAPVEVKQEDGVPENPWGWQSSDEDEKKLKKEEGGARPDPYRVLDQTRVNWDDIEAKEEAEASARREAAGVRPPAWLKIPPFESRHRPLLSLLRELREEITSGARAPQMQLILESVSNFIIRRYRVTRQHIPSELREGHDIRVDPRLYESAVSMEVARNQLPMGNAASYIILRIDRHVQLIRDFEDKVRQDLLEKEKEKAKRELEKKEKKEKEELAWEPEWPSKVVLMGSPCVMAGPPNWASSPLDFSLGGSSLWVRRLLWGDPVRPRMDAVLCGPRNRLRCDDSVGHAVEGKELRRGTKGGGHVDLGVRDGLKLVPPVELCREWTIDCWFKWPLRGVADDRVLVATEWDQTGAHIVWKRNIVGCEVPVESPEGRVDRRRNFSTNESWSVHVKFYAAEKRDEENNLWTYNFSKLQWGWHRLTAVGRDRGETRPMMYYLDGRSIGGVNDSPVAPIAVIGNRFRGTCPVGNGIARFRIFGFVLTDAEIAEMCGLDPETVEQSPFLVWGAKANKNDWLLRRRD